MRIFVIVLLSGTLGILGCETTSGDGEGGSAGTGGSTGSGGSAGSGGNGGEGGAGGEAGMGGMAGVGGQGGAGSASAAATFCNSFERLCSYGGENYTDRADCLSSYEGYDMTRQECVVTHLANAAGEDPGSAARASHCGHASGLSPCGPTR